MAVRHMAAGVLAASGGLLMVLSGYASKGLLYSALGYAEPKVTYYLSGTVADVVLVGIGLVQAVIGLGGLLVLGGGIAMVGRHVTVGRILVLLGGGAGFVGLLIAFGYSVARMGIDPALGYFPYWAGLGLAVFSRRLAKSS